MKVKVLTEIVIETHLNHINQIMMDEVSQVLTQVESIINDKQYLPFKVESTKVKSLIQTS